MLKFLIPIIFIALMYIIFSSPVYFVLRTLGIPGIYSGVFFILFIAIAILSRTLGPSWISGIIRKAVNGYLGFGFILFFVTLIGALIARFFEIRPLILISCIIVATGLITIAGMMNARGIDVRHFEISSPKIAQDFRIVHLTDLHIGSNDGSRLSEVADIVNKQHPDVVLMTGDFIDEKSVGPDDIEGIDGIISDIYYVTGNHDTYLNDTLNTMSATKIKTLDGAAASLGEINLIGFGDTSDLSTVENLVAPGKFNILMYHQPRHVDRFIASGADIMLSGHTHAGQIFPFNLFLHIIFDYTEGEYSFGKKHLFVGPGTLTWGPGMRLGSRNEIYVIDIIPDAGTLS